MEETDDQFRRRVVESLKTSDSVTRAARAERHVWLSEHRPIVGAIADRAETLAVLAEASETFESGHFIATLLLALAYVEHALADAFPPPPPPAPGKRRKHGPPVSDLLKMAEEKGYFTSDLLSRAGRLSEVRNAYVHRRAPDDEHTLWRRFRARKEHPKKVLESDAKEALQVMYGFFLHSLHPWPEPGAANDQVHPQSPDLPTAP